MHPVVARAEQAREWREHLRRRCGARRKANTAPHAILIAQVVTATSEYFGIPPKVIMSKDRGTEAVRARQIAMYLARRLSGRSFPEIGRQMGGFDHSTVLYSVRKIEADIETEPDVRIDADLIASAVLHGW